MSGAVLIEGDRVELRTVEDEDVEFFHETVNDPRVWRPMFTYRPYNSKQESEYIEGLNESDDNIILVIFDDGDPVGGITLDGIDDVNGHAEISYFIAPESQGNGYATEAIEIFLDYGFENLGLHKVTARTYDFNEASQALLEKVGFTREGVHREEAYANGEYRNVYYYGILKND